MKQLLMVTTIAFTVMSAIAQNKNTMGEAKRIQTIEDKLAIKNVVDVFSNLADTKEVGKQVLLFTEDGAVQSGFGDNKMVIKGRKQLFDAFSGYLARFDIVYHQNGQQTIDELTDTTAKTTSYCRVVLVGTQNGKTSKITHYIIYHDSFVKQNGAWLIKNRDSNFVRTETE